MFTTMCLNISQISAPLTSSSKISRNSVKPTENSHTTYASKLLKTLSKNVTYSQNKISTLKFSKSKTKTAKYQSTNSKTNKLLVFSSNTKQKLLSLTLKVSLIPSTTSMIFCKNRKASCSNISDRKIKRRKQGSQLLDRKNKSLKKPQNTLINENNNLKRLSKGRISDMSWTPLMVFLRNHNIFLMYAT